MPRTQEYQQELHRLQQLHQRVSAAPTPPVEPPSCWQVNPTLEMLRCAWRGLPSLLERGGEGPPPRPGAAHVLLWRCPGSGTLTVREAGLHDLLALKLVAETIDPRQAAREGGVGVAVIDGVLARAAAEGLVLRPLSAICREGDFPRGQGGADEFFRSPVFTLQWHLTQACDLHCRHCYDRSPRTSFSLEQCLAVLDDLDRFCRERHVAGQVSFSGGNPLLYPHFLAVYRAAAERGLQTAILGNPCSRERLAEIIAIQRPEFFQVSLEGLAEHNDYIRGAGHFARVMAFLDLLRELQVYSMVMLTLTRDNQAQVLPLAEQLRGRVDLFTFNRLAPVGEGAALAMAPPEGYPDFLAEYLAAAADNPCMALKDSLFNITLRQQGRPLFGGCAGHGCGAAFNFVALLPDGELHACRKFSSPIGHIRQGLDAVYDGTAARRYRQGAAECRDCPIRPVCGGCLAVTQGAGQDCLRQRDPYCFSRRPAEQTTASCLYLDH